MDYLLSRFNSFSLDKQELTPQNLLDRTKTHWNYNHDSDTLIVCLPGWRQELWTWARIEKYAKQSGYSFLAYEFPRPILSDSVNLTLECFKTINNIVRNDIKKLKNKHGFNKCILVGISLASSFGSIIYKDNPDITDIILIVPGENLARDMWHGCRTQHIRKSFESQGISLEALEKQWELLASENNFPEINTKIGLCYGKNDKVIPFKFSRQLEEVLSARHFRIKTKITRFGHYFLIYWFLLFPAHFYKKMLVND